MVIDFKEIPQANKGGGNQDKFELFSRDFIKILGYEIISDPARGADGGLDFKVKETRKKQDGNQNIFWLASCKHYAHSGTAINSDIESNILDRVVANGCQGFIGIYSTIPSNGLIKLLQGLSAYGKVEHRIFDHEKIESHIVGISSLENLFLRYFPNSYKKWKETYYFKEPLNLFEHYLNNKYDESIKKILLTSFYSIGNLIKALRKHSRIEESLLEHGIKLIHDPTFYFYNHRRDLKYISDVKPFKIQRSQWNNFYHVFKPNSQILDAYLNGQILPSKGSGLVKYDYNYDYEKVKYKYRLILPSNSFLYFYLNFQSHSIAYLFTSLIIVNNEYYQQLNDLFCDLKEMLS